ncbi:doubled motif LPXTG anchor domain-containing protein [Enterocloster sp.]|uniref:doubled motif LPXTG anchor domain-containing protein n=1 Tax=Enterocloster sp. TaxID=2719315 RepID=UPI0030775F06
MEGQKRPRVFLQKRYNTQKRFLALMLAFAMIFTSVGTDLNVAYAAEGNRVDFEIYGADLVEAINDAVETQSPVTADDLNFTNGAIEKFDALFFGEGKVYEVFPPVEGGDMDAEVRVFVRLPEDADDMYMVTGDEEVIFLYINNGEDTISCSTKIIRTVDGEEKVKSTKRITVKSYEDKFGEEESNIISKPEETLPAVPETSAPESQPEETPAETLNPAETTAPEETTIPEETEAPDATEESSETEETTEAPESTEAQETETSEETKEEVTEAETEATEAEKEETEAVEETEEPETETDEEKSQDDSAVTLSSISRHQVPVVAVKEDAELIETEAEETEKETTAAPEKETTAAEETTSKETTAAPEESTEATEETSTEAESSEEATESEEATTAPETQETEETTEAETEVPAETETTAPAETETQAPVQSATPAEPEEGSKPAATDTDLVGMGWCSTAKAYTTTLKALKVFESQIELTADVAGAENVTVTLSAMPGVVPEGSYVEAEAITDEDQLNLMKKEADKKLMKKNLAAVDIFAADVMLYDADGNEIWPDGNVKVTFEGTGIDGGSSTVYHINEGSTYAKIEAEETYYYEVNFYYNNGQEDVLISGVQYVKEGERAIVPDAPEQEGKNFVGWEPELGPITEDTNFYAQYAENAEQIHLTVNYQYKDGSSAAQPWVAEVQAGVKCDYTVESPSIDGFEPDQKEVVFKDAYDTDQTVTVTYTGAEGRYQIEHWLLDVQGNKTGEPAETETAVGEVGNYTQAVSKEYEGFTAREISQVKIGSDGNTVVEVLYERNSYTLTWNTGEGGSYIAPSEIVYGAAVETPAKDPSRLGYDFAGWENLPATMPAQDTVVTAKWNPAQKADYKVIYWKETLTKGEYAVGEITYGKGGFVGNNIPYSTQKNYEGFKLNETKSEGNVEITPDGMAVKNVYYDRETYTIKFMRKKSRKWYEDTNLRITARYGEDVSKQWEKACEKDGWGPNKDESWGESIIQYTLIANMPADHLTMYEKDPTGSEKMIYYYVEGLEGNKEVYARFKVGRGVSLSEEDKQPITGFTFSEWKKESNSLPWEKPADLWLYYTRNSYELYFENCEMDSASIKFEALLSTGKPLREPGRPANVDDDYQFAGWYLDPAFENPVDWNAAMPADNIRIYAKWQAPEYTVSFETNGGNFIDPITVTKGDQIELPRDPEKEGDTFLGWYTDADFVKKFISESKIVEDITLYAKWESSETVTYTVRYVTEVNGEQKDIWDSKEGTAKLGTSVTEEAVAVEGYYPRSMFLTRNISKPGMVITFEYDPVQTWQYTVKYLLKDDSIPVADEETFETSNHAVAVNFKHIDGYTLVSDPVVTVTKDSAEAVFYYTTQKAIYHTQHWREGLTGEFGLYSIDTVSDVAAGNTVQAIPATYEGFTYDSNHAGTVASGTTDIQNILTMKLYYTRNQHQVKYEITGDIPYGVVPPVESTHKYKTQIDVEVPLNVPGYTFSGWTTEDVQVNNNKFVMPDKDVVLKGSFTENAAVRISYRPDDAEHGSVTLEGEDVAPATGNPAGSTASEKEGWAFKYWTKGDQIVSWDKTLSKEVIDANSKVDGLYITTDYVAVFGEDENRDKIPDEYQVKVTYEAVNGSVSIAETYVTLYKDGHYATKAEGGVGYLTEDQIAEATANAGYNQASESWKPEKPEAGVTKITTVTNYVITFTENAAVRISYSPDDAEHGSVSPEGEEVKPATGTPVGSTATAKDGWAFKHWTKDGEIVSWDRNLSKEVIDANSKDANDLYVESGYVAVFGEDKNKDNIPDDLQIVFTYVADNNGTLEGITSEYHNKYKVKADGTLELGSDGNSIPVEGMINPEVNVTITPSTGYKFDSWTDSNNNTYNTTDALKAAQYAVKDETFTAHFTKDEFAYKVYKHYEKAETVVAKEGTGTFEENILSVSGIVLADAEDYNGHHYILEKVDGTGSVITANVDSNRVDIYYVLDEKGGTDPTDPTNPNRPDGVADKYQTVFKYVSAGNGSVTGTTYEVHTFKENGKYTEASKMPVSPKAEVSVTPADKYVFDYWTIDESQKDYSSEMVALKSQKYNQDTTFVVHFDTDGNGDRIPDKYQVIVSYEAVNGTVTITEPVYVTLYKDGHYATPEEGGAGKLEADQIADASPLDGFDPSTEQWKANDKVAEKPTTETQITENTKYVVTFGKNGYVYDVVKRYLDVNGNLVDEIVTSATALYGENILEVSGVTVLQEEVFRDEFYELVSVDGADRLITSDLEANHVEIVYQQKEYGYDVVKRFLNAAGEEVDAVTKLGTALYGDNILEVSKVTTEQEELYKDNLYELVEIKGADLLITNDIQANHVEVIYQQKEYGYDVVKRFLNAAGEEVDTVTKLGTAAYGTNILEASDVTVLQEELHNGNLYELVKVEGADLLISNDIQANHVEVIYQQKEYSYDVVKRFLNAAGEEVDAVTKLGTAAYGTNILEASDVTVLQEELHDGNLYELVKVEGADLLISNDIQANHVEIIYQQKNYNYEVVKHYEGLNETAVESTKGTAPYGTGILEMSNVDVLQHETYKEHTYVLTKVDGADKLITNDETQNRVDIYYVLDEKGGTDPTDPTNPDKPDGHPDKYQIIFRYVSADEAMGTVSVTEAEVHTFTDDAGNYVDKKEISPNGATAHALGGFAFDYWADTEGRDYTADMQNMKSQTYLEDTTFTAHFSEDKIGETDPQNPDGIPDNRQITFRYVSENPSYGTVSGTVVEVRTIMEVVEGENGYQVLETKSVNPFAEVTVSANGRYRFEHWSDGTTNFANADEISAASYSADAVFTAYFNYYSGGGSGGGGGGNGGGPSGSGGDSSRGPGVTVTIDNPDVPLAPAPETGTGDVISINDGMVPMAPLPKTGQTTMRSTLLMAFSGILLAITGFSKKRKEEEN